MVLSRSARNSDWSRPFFFFFGIGIIAWPWILYTKMEVRMPSLPETSSCQIAPSLSLITDKSISERSSFESVYWSMCFYYLAKALCWRYHATRILRDSHSMLLFHIGIFFIACWSFLYHRHCAFSKRNGTTVLKHYRGCMNKKKIRAAVEPRLDRT
jgi:hypothetical protein